MSKRGQISTEYLIIVGFVVFLVISVLGVALFYTSGSQEHIRSSNLGQFANTVIVNAEEVYYSGEPSMRTFSVYLPSGVENVSITTYEIIFTFVGHGGSNIISYPSNVPLYGEISSHEGLKRLQLVAQPNRVFISEA